MFRFPFHKRDIVSGAAGGVGSASPVGGISNAVSSIGGLALGIAQLVMQSKANKQAREDQFYFYNDQKNWQDPSNQMRLRRLAGLNPYGDFSTGSVGQPTPVNMSQGIAEATGLMANSMNQGVAQHFNYMAQKIAIKQLELEEKRVENDTKIADANAKLLGSKNLYQEFLNFIADNTKGNQITLSNLDVEEALQRIISMEKYNNWFDSFKKLESQNLLEQILSSRYMRTVYNPKFLAMSGSKINAEIAKMAAETDLLNLDKQEVKFSSDLYESLNNLGDNLPKGTPKAVVALIKGLAQLAKIYIVSQSKNR